jgi:hypothetical protein
MTRDDYVGSGWSGWRLSDVFGFTTVSRAARAPTTCVGSHVDGVLARQDAVDQSAAILGDFGRAAHVAGLVADAAGADAARRIRS